MPMMEGLESLATRWISRWAEPRAEAVEATRGLTPAVVITGGSSGIGLALAHEFARHSQAVVLTARTPSRLETAAIEILQRQPNVRVEQLSLDISRPEAIEVLSSWLAEKRLYCDVLVNNAAIGHSGPFSAAPTTRIETLIATNVAAVARLTRAVLPDMIARGRGGILTISSLGALIPGPHQAAYYASKAFALSLTEAIASEAAGRGVRIAVVLPGPVETRFHARMDAEGSLYRHILAAATPERVAALSVRSYRLGRRVIAPGLVPTLAVPFLRILPHAISVPIVNWLLDTGRPALRSDEDKSSPLL
ncbi:MAG TPA: SDR family NAD(P)-dependent oxidoreductase [Hyphomicrobium sp.]|nr:SDR family NAD(P)-dependent oxidoreductase [Hyphomicrobium sp.]